MKENTLGAPFLAFGAFYLDLRVLFADKGDMQSPPFVNYALRVLFPRKSDCYPFFLGFFRSNKGCNLLQPKIVRYIMFDKRGQLAKNIVWDEHFQWELLFKAYEFRLWDEGILRF